MCSSLKRSLAFGTGFMAVEVFSAALAVSAVKHRSAQYCALHGSLLRSAACSCIAVARASIGPGGVGLVGAPPGSSGQWHVLYPTRVERFQLFSVRPFASAFKNKLT